MSFTEGAYKEPIEATYEQYLADREVLYKGRDDKFVCLMDLALLAMKKLSKEGKLEDLGGVRGDQCLQHRGSGRDRRSDRRVAGKL